MSEKEREGKKSLHKCLYFGKLSHRWQWKTCK